MSEDVSSPEAILLVGTHCPHCESVLQHASKLVKHGEFSQLTVHNVDQQPDVIQQYQVRSVPWIRIGQYELTGAQTYDALLQRVQWVKEQRKLEGEFDYLLSEAQADKVLGRLHQKPEQMQAIIKLLGDSATVLSTRIGIGVVVEEFAGTPTLQEYIPQLSELSQHKDARIRADACHYLGLTESQIAIEPLENCQNDTDPEVREVVVDSLEILREIQKN
ncbi:MAG: Unknown protein [uncultured Thiotrichaceae bacterium]|uniref:Thioredoxin-like fold domain-containing protein n=1 Tax=uncultured Thiotrichaceae bacterium TaxID=298394 RepID=A0A6S6UBX4_9GAMM|nr:MAG: Unknown protein [uncultured Thiotrichaceae bacterium]